jgi:hypothetical protein
MFATIASLATKVMQLILLIGGLALSLAHAQQGRHEEIGLVRIWEMVGQGQVLPALALAERAFETKRIGRGDLAQLLAVIGQERRIEDLLASGATHRSNVPGEDQSDEQFSTKPALQAIAEMAKDKRVVILNESHFDQRHRAFATLLAGKLRTLGFTHFGAETFKPGVVQSMQDDAPDAQTGIYVADPVFGDLVRQAKRQGYILFPFEQSAEQSRVADAAHRDARLMRERDQAANITAVLRGNPTARVFVYVGGSHVLEAADASGAEWMAALLKQESGLDPLTIDQTAGTPRLSTVKEGALYRAIKPFLKNRIVVAKRVNGEHVAKPGVDVVVFHPQSGMVNSRPGWLSMCGYRAPYEVAIGPSHERSLARAFVVGEPSGAIPMDQVVVEQGQSLATLMLPAGRYRIELQSEAGRNSVLIENFDTSKSTTPVSTREIPHATSCP